MYNQNAKPLVEQRKREARHEATKFAREAKTILRTPKRTVLISLMANYGLKIREARAIYALA